MTNKFKNLNPDRMFKLIITAGKMPDGSITEAPAYYPYPRTIEGADYDVDCAAWGETDGTRYTSQEGTDNSDSVKLTDIIKEN